LTLKRPQTTTQNMRFRKGLFLLILGTLIFSGCVAQQQDIEALRAQIYQVNTRLDAFDKRLTALETEVARLNDDWQRFEKSRKQMDQLSERQVELLSELEKLQAEQMRLTGQLEQLLYQQGQDREAFQAFQKQVLARLDQVERALSPKKTKKASPQKKKPLDEETLYKKALSLYRQKKYEEAQALFREYLQKYPRGKRAANATFWIGECLYQRKLYEDAILQYQKVIDEFPRSGKVPAALLKQGLAFLRLGDTEAATIVFKKLVRLYPRTEQARIARKYLAKLKRS